MVTRVDNNKSSCKQVVRRREPEELSEIMCRRHFYATNRGGVGSRIIEEVPAVDTAENIIHCVLGASEVGLKH